jgi:hypothetical protein
MLVMNRDELTIPLDAVTIPSAQEFKSAIESLSEEQQRFAKQFRAMQLASTLFAVAIVQVKPQLESLLRLPKESLTKHIQLTQDLMRMFVQYQIPSDLLACKIGEIGNVDTVRGNVKNVFEVRYNKILFVMIE